MTESFYTSPENKEVLINDDSTPNNFIFKEIFEYQVYTGIPEMKIKEDDVVIDIGAHIGIFSKYSATQYSKRVIAFEMNPKYFVCLRQNVRPQDDIFNCVLLDKNLSKFKLENGVIVNGFDFYHFYSGGLFDKIDFMKVDVMGKETFLLKSISKKIYNNIKKVSVKCYDMTENDKFFFKEFMNFNGFVKTHEVIIPNQSIQFLYFWK